MKSRIFLSFISLLIYISNISFSQINNLPVVNFDVSTVSGGPFEAPVWVKFYPSGTYDPDGYIILFEIDMNGDGIYDVESSTLTGGSYEFTTPGDYVASVRVTDDRGGVTIGAKSFTILDPIMGDDQESDYLMAEIEPVSIEPIEETKPYDTIDQNIDSEPIDEELNEKLDSIINNYKTNGKSEVVELTEIEPNYEQVKKTTLTSEPPIIIEDEITAAVQPYETSVPETEHIEIDKTEEEPLSNVKENPVIVEDKRTPELLELPVMFSDDSKIPIAADSYVYSYAYRNWNDANFGRHDVITTGWHSTGGEKRTYLKFDLPNVETGMVENAKLKLYHCKSIGKNTSRINIYKVLEDWIEGEGVFHEGKSEPSDSSGVITWNIQPTYSDSIITQFKPKKKTNVWIEIDITNLVNEWLSGDPNYGIMLKPGGDLSGREPTSIYEFYSKDFEDTSKIPHVEIQF